MFTFDVMIAVSLFQLEYQPKQGIDLRVQYIHILKFNIIMTFTLKSTQIYHVFWTCTIVVLWFYHLIPSMYHYHHIP